MHDEIKCLLKKARAGDREARSEIVQKNLGLSGMLSGDLMAEDTKQMIYFRLDV